MEKVLNALSILQVLIDYRIIVVVLRILASLVR